MDWITNSKLFKASKHQDKILAAIADPVNQPLVKQLTAYVEPEYKDNESVEDDNLNEESAKTDDSHKADEKSSKPAKPASFHKSSAKTLDSKPESEELEDSEEPISVDVKPDNSESEEVENSTKVSKDSIQAGTYVTVEAVSQAVNEIPGMLNLTEDTKGATCAMLKGSATSELWIYYDSEIDINKVLDKATRAIDAAGYYFLEFNKVSREENAIIFTINWVSNYFRPAQLGNVDEQ